MAQYIVYSDGACAPSNPGPASWGAVVIGGKPMVRRFYGFIGHGTNQVAELTAAIEGLKLTPPGSEVELVSDSQYTLKGISEWRKGWERRGWKNAAGQPVANKELWMTLFMLVDGRKVTTRWVKGHAGDKYNEAADELANLGLKAPKGVVMEVGGEVVPKQKAKVEFNVGNEVSLPSTEEVGLVLAVWNDATDVEWAYVAFVGTSWPEGQPAIKPSVHLYKTSELMKLST